jgi:membrane-associated protein
MRMELWLTLWDFIRHVDAYVLAWTEHHGLWVYAILFAIVFVETGVVVMPLLPGDSLLFVVGALAGAGLLSWPVAAAVLLAAAFLGDQCNYHIGRWVGPRVWRWEQSRWFNRRAFDLAHAYYERWGGITVVVARFVPFLRTFVPFAAGVSAMHRGVFVGYNALGALLWVLGVTALGYVLGQSAWVKANLQMVIWALVLAPGLLALLGVWRAQRRALT